MNFIGCEGNLTEATIGRDHVPNVLACDTGWVIVTEQELLSGSSQNQLLSREDFNILSAAILAIMILAMVLRVILRNLNYVEIPK